MVDMPIRSPLTPLRSSGRAVRAMHLFPLASPLRQLHVACDDPIANLAEGKKAAEAEEERAIRAEEETIETDAKTCEAKVVAEPISEAGRVEKLIVALEVLRGREKSISDMIEAKRAEMMLLVNQKLKVHSENEAAMKALMDLRVLGSSPQFTSSSTDVIMGLTGKRVPM